MNIGEKMQEAINDQIQAEFYASYMYLSMAAYFEANNLSGFAKWMKLQAEEEKEHAMKLFGYVCERGGKVTLKAIDAPKASWNGPLEVFEETYAHEKKVTGLIYKLFELAAAEKDYTSQSFLKWFIDEQVEEEAGASAIVEKIKFGKEAAHVLMYIDKELGKRGGCC